MEGHIPDYDNLIRENESLRKQIGQVQHELAELKKRSANNSSQNRFQKSFKIASDYLTKMGHSFHENVQIITRLCGKLSGATFTLYNRYDKEMMNTVGHYKTPPNFNLISKPEGQICFDLIRSNESKLVVINDLQNSPYAETDPMVMKYKLVTFIGKSVMCDGVCVGAICSFYNTPVNPNFNHEQVFTVAASALTYEEVRKKGQKKLRESEERFRSAFHTSPDPMCINRLSDGMYIDVNQSFTNISGFTETDVSGKTTTDLRIWKNSKEKHQLIQTLVRDGYIENMDVQFRMKGGDYKTALISARLFLLKGAPHVLSVTRDMTERNLAIKAIEESEHKLRSVVENAFDGIYLISNDRFTYANQRFCDIIDHSREEIFSSECELCARLAAKCTQLIAGQNQSGWNDEQIPGIYELEIITKTGEIREVEVSTVRINDEIDKVTVLGIMRDITERKRLFEELVVAKNKAEEVNILKSRLLANLSHEIRTPLNGILGFAEMLKEDLKDPSEKSMANIIYTSGFRLLHTLNAILDLSTIESQFGNLNLKNVCLKQVAHEVTTLFQPVTRKKDISISFVTSEEDITVIADEELVNKILNNLVNNAIKFTHQGGITVSTSIMDDGKSKFGCIQVSDTGIGIKEENQMIIFDEFRQVSEGQSRSYDGAGLGLHISKRFAEMMGGKISVNSRISDGSTFTLSLPLR